MRARATQYLSLTLSVLVFWTDCAFAHAPEKALWLERRRALQQRNEPATRPLQLASLPAPTSDFLEQGAPASWARSTSRPPFPGFGSSSLLNGNPSNGSLLSILTGRYGTIRKVKRPDRQESEKIVIHIQDVHMNQEAQKNIGATLQELINQKKVDLVALEGAFAPINLTPFRTFPHHDTVRKVADYFLRENKISGSVHTAFVSPTDSPPVVGVDDRLHYDANVEAYRQSAPLVKKVKAELVEQQQKLFEERHRTFNPELSAFDARVQAYRSGALAMGDYIAVLTSTSKAGASPAARAFSEALKLERSLNFTQVEAERSQLLSDLLPKLTKDETSHFVSASVAFRAGNLGHQEFYRSLADLCEKTGVHLAQFPSMKNYLRYVALAESLDSEALFQEIKNLEEKAFASLAKTPEEKQLIAESKKLYLVGKLLDFALTKDEWAEYRSARQPSTPSKNSLLKSFEAFYEEAETRDRLMAQNLLKAMDEHHAKVAVLVTGGFHARGISQFANDAGFTTISFVPKITKVNTENGSAYLSVFTQEKTPLEKLFEGEKLFLSPLQTESLADAGLMAASLESDSQTGVTPANWTRGEKV